MQLSKSLFLLTWMCLFFSNFFVSGVPINPLGFDLPLTSVSLLWNATKSVLNVFISHQDNTLVIENGIISVYDLGNKSNSDSFDLWLKEQTNISFTRILDNIGGIGSNLQNVSEGAVIASPSKSKPNYFYQWIRDAAITMQSLIEYLKDHSDDNNTPYSKKLRFAIESYIVNNYILQHLDTKSGTWESGDTLGEPKFLVDSTPFNEHWGRPQRDGPGLRVITIADYLKYLENNKIDISHKKLPSSKYIYEEIVKKDLTYVINSWNKIGFDLWEEVNSFHFFTSITMLKALKVGIELAVQFQDDTFLSRLRIAFTSLRMFILIESGFKDAKIPYIIETPSLTGERSGLDIGSILGCLRSHDLNDGTDLIAIPFSLTDSAVMGSLIGLINDMKYRYPINHEKGNFNNGFALGRYPEDVYDGYGLSEGNPWFIATASAAEFIFKLAYHLYDQKLDLVITKDQYAFYSTFINLNPNIQEDKVIMPFASKAFIKTTLSLLNYGDTFLEVIKLHVAAGGHMSEQFNRYTGYLEGAEDLTWSYGSFWSATRWRDKALDNMNNNSVYIGN
ncbi:hypothetical protein CANINC_004534 [Pichia inconspicua]|uniref:glucan 1,4-alpha-glucosidase n=1 Tax=Pichia inconspicua TaxID=52247 RepID=A0A4T0WVJ2_9ASCO|nr:hypothetical protein CANINC_004534 [[Candida] inconspicua]